MLKHSFRRFGLLHSTLGIFDTSSKGYQIGINLPSQAIPDHNPLIREDGKSSLAQTTLPNGVRVVSEVGAYPGSVFVGVTIDSGTRDETAKNSSVIHALEKTYLKTNVRTNEQINYGMIQMSGGKFTMSYNQEFIHYSGQCLAHDTYDFLQMLSDSVLDEKTVMDEEAAQWRIDEWWKLRSVNITIPRRIEELWLSTAYGHTGFGMPLSGFESNFQNIGFYVMNSFRKNYITPGRMIVWGAGIENHADFVQAVTPYFDKLEPTKSNIRAPSKYIGGDYRELLDSPLTHVGLSFHGLPRSNPDTNAAYVLKYVIGKKGSGLHNRAATKFATKYKGLAYLDPHHTTFQDTGNFRINFAATNDKVGEVCQGVVDEIKDLANITQDEVDRAKNYLVKEAINKFLDPGVRVMKSVATMHQTGQLRSTADFVKDVEDVTLDRVKATAAKIFKSFPTVVAIGGNTHDVPDAEAFFAKLK